MIWLQDLKSMCLNQIDSSIFETTVTHGASSLDGNSDVPHGGGLP